MENVFKTVYIVEKNGRAHFLHWRYKFGPLGLAAGAIAPLAVKALPLALKFGPPLLELMASKKEGEEGEDIAKRRAAIDFRTAEAVRQSSIENAKIKGEKGRRLIEEQKSQAAAGNIKINVGAPLVIEAQTRSDIAEDIGFSLARGREEEAFFRSRGELELFAAKQIKKKSKFDILGQGLGIASLGLNTFGGSFGGFTKLFSGATSGGSLKPGSGNFRFGL